MTLIFLNKKENVLKKYFFSFKKFSKILFQDIKNVKKNLIKSSQLMFIFLTLANF
jgi:hypothetical protein